MKKVNVYGTITIPIGIRGENDARQIVFDLSSFVRTYGEGDTYLRNDGLQISYCPTDELRFTLNGYDAKTKGRNNPKWVREKEVDPKELPWWNIVNR